MRGWWREFGDLVLPTGCAGCGRARGVLCAGCREALGGAVPRRVRPVPEPPGLPAVFAAAPYGDAVRAVLLAHKERGALGLGRELGVALAGAVWVGVEEGPTPAALPLPRPRPLPPPRPLPLPLPLLLVPVPSAPAAVRSRGHDPTRRIALAAAGVLRRAGRPARVAAVLRQGRRVSDQAGLDSRQRRENLRGALVVVPGGARVLADGPVVLVDDLMTTGASLAEAARAVREAVNAVNGVNGVNGVHAVNAVHATNTGVYPDQRGSSPSGRAVRRGSGGSVRGGIGWGTAGKSGGGGGVTVEGSRRTDGDADREAGSAGGTSADGGPPRVLGGRTGGVLCAAVVAASADSFGMSRN
ncbi:ComF family protein [Streptomyces lasalocidi]|uniref:ComF family protein n=1 Tax=Streptomyces lasalocidi TaxID=324833 RepID=A0A4U5WTA7_STRLS|nr:ComF family protein [Streptomyces lasalocidi]TKT05002.1 ComF family protein [Streptomyces lasalocidi]